jgi:hypothetical protein
MAQAGPVRGNDHPLEAGELETRESNPIITFVSYRFPG